MNKVLMFWVLVGFAQSMFGNISCNGTETEMLIQNIKESEMSLLYKQGTYGSICFPYKKSCEFATKKCLVQCSDRYCDSTLAEKTFEAFKRCTALQLFTTINTEMKDNDYKLLAWFDSGDCPKDMTDKVIELIFQFHEKGYSQIGFTRNKKLWKAVRGLYEKDEGYSDIKTKTRFLLTVERGRKITDEGYYAIPDYKKQRVCILFHHTFRKPVSRSVDEAILSGDAFVRYCGGCSSYVRHVTVTEPVLKAYCDASNSNAGTMEDLHWDQVHEANCEYCLDDDRGCFEDQ